MGRAHWSLVDRARWSVQQRIVVEELFIETNWMTAMGIVFHNSFADVLPVLAMFCYCVYQNGMKREQGGIQYLNYFQSSTHTNENVKKLKNVTF
jgi:hypothetical protein